jgi:enamine deaminase RidA (YjgF/YER057c/UK114 family)
VPTEFIDADTLNKPHGYRHAAVTTGTRTVYVAGQVSVDADGNTVGIGDHRAQARRALTNVIEALAAAGATPAQLVRLNMYAVGLNVQTRSALYRGLGEASRERGVVPVPATLVGVEALGGDDLLIEIDAIAVLD